MTMMLRGIVGFTMTVTLLGCGGGDGGRADASANDGAVDASTSSDVCFGTGACSGLSNEACATLDGAGCTPRWSTLCFPNAYCTTLTTEGACQSSSSCYWLPANEACIALPCPSNADQPTCGAMGCIYTMTMNGCEGTYDCSGLPVSSEQACSGVSAALGLSCSPQ